MATMEKEAATPIGFIGQGWIGKNYADDFEDRGYATVRYALEEPYRQNRERVSECDTVFIAVPTPTTPAGFDDSIVRAAVALVGSGKTAVIKSTMVPGTAICLQEQYADRIVLYSPEFLSEATAREDVRSPFASIVGMTRPDAQRAAAEATLALLPAAPFLRIMTSTEAELFKYAHNTSGYVQVVFFNMLYELAQSLGGSWDTIQEAIAADPYISNRYADPLHKSGRGAGGNCFIKDFAALKRTYAEHRSDDLAGAAVFQAIEAKNLELLASTGKDAGLVKGVYGSKRKP